MRILLSFDVIVIGILDRSKAAGMHETALDNGSGLHILGGFETVYASIEEIGQNCSSIEGQGAVAFVHKT